ncbi:MAG: hypothetical protein ACLRMJ_00470 [Alistipes finegoldii]
MGILGVKVWICQGIVYGKRDLFEMQALSAQAPSGTVASAVIAETVAAAETVAEDAATVATAVVTSSQQQQ